jgi:SAM-dependent methyltransferase
VSDLAETETSKEPGGATATEGPPGAATPGDERTLLGPRLRLVALSFLMLFGQLALIRWLGASVFYLSFFSNFVLLGSFLGFGLGFLWAGRSPKAIYPAAPLLFGALVAYVYVFDVPLDVTTTNLIFFETVEPVSPLPAWLVLSILFVAVASVMACVGNGVARAFGLFSPLDAYKWDLVGSVAGIATFTALSFLGARPLVWGLVIAAVFVGTTRIGSPAQWAATGLGILVLIVPLVVELGDEGVTWSPYYKITEHENEAGGLGTTVNQSPHWEQIPVTDEGLYPLIYDKLATPEGGDVLVIGAGSGNDVEAALQREADSVDAVEIDGRLMDIAERGHPDEPYEDPRVDVHIDDGRAFLERTSETYDRILFALPDSLTLVPGQSSVRLESYLFTEEAVQAARERLNPGGVFAMYNYYREGWLVDRYANTIGNVFEQPPCVTEVGAWHLSVLLASDDASAIDCPAEDVWSPAADVEPVTDDRPFPYVRDRGLGNLRLYIFSGAAMLAFSLLMVRVVGGPLRSVSRYSDLLFMGVAFMLLETKSVVQFALLFGTTWLVNALVFLGVLTSVLIAVGVSRRVTFRRPARLYGVLLASLAVAYLIPIDRLLALPIVPRFLAAVTLAFFPIFTANLVFTQRFKDTAHSTVAFGANLLGAMAGGLLEYSALVAGYRNLIFLVAIAYGLAFLTGRKHLAPAPA